jgi:predicted transposase/invertase (TIGR01784 family)
MSKSKKKHDPLARKFLSDVVVAKEFLATYLAPSLLSKFELNSLIVDAGSYVEDDLKTSCSDIVYKLDLKKNKGSGYIYVLVEHQSTALELMPLRIMKYQLAIIEKHLAKYKQDKLPLVVPLVFYNGEVSPYPYDLDIASLFADYELYSRLPLGKFNLVDLTIIEDNEILQHGKLALLEILLKHIRERDFFEVVATVVRAFQIAHDANINIALINGAFSYVVHAREEDEIKELIKQIELQAEYYTEDIMTYAEALLKRGREEGMQEGMQKGKHEGKQEGKQEAYRDIAKSMLKAGISLDIIKQVTSLSDYEITSLANNN